MIIEMNDGEYVKFIYKFHVCVHLEMPDRLKSREIRNDTPTEF